MKDKRSKRCKCGSVQFIYNGDCLVCGTTGEENAIFTTTRLKTAEEYHRQFLAIGFRDGQSRQLATKATDFTIEFIENALIVDLLKQEDLEEFIQKCIINRLLERRQKSIPHV